MSNAIQYFQQAEFALAAYSNLSADMPIEAYWAALQQGGKGMSLAQAQEFASTYKVIAQFNDTFNGASATIFQKTADGPTGQKYLAIRGTEASGSDLA